MPTNIEWTRGDDGSKGETWNPLAGCEYASPGCTGCYAAREAFGRLRGVPLYAGLAHRRTPDELPRFTGEIRLAPERLDQPLRWKRPRRVFVNSMSDLFHPDVPDEFVGRVWSTMRDAPQHTFQVLTKRPQRMASLLSRFRTLDGGSFYIGDRGDPFVLPQVWCGTSVENQRYADLRIPHLLATPAAVRFLSVEPLLGPVDLSAWLHGGFGRAGDHDEIDWVIVGGESGPRARAMHPQWVRDLRDQCTDNGVPFLFKQWGEWGPARWERATHIVEMDGTRHPRYGEAIAPIVDRGGAPMYRWGKKAAGRALDGRTWDEFPS